MGVVVGVVSVRRVSRVEPLYVVIIILINSALSSLRPRWMVVVCLFRVSCQSKTNRSTTNSLHKLSQVLLLSISNCCTLLCVVFVHKH